MVLRKNALEGATWRKASYEIWACSDNDRSAIERPQFLITAAAFRQKVGQRDYEGTVQMLALVFRLPRLLRSWILGATKVRANPHEQVRSVFGLLPTRHQGLAGERHPLPLLPTGLLFRSSPYGVTLRVRHLAGRSVRQVVPSSGVQSNAPKASRM